MQDTLGASPDPQSTIDFFNDLAGGTDTAAGTAVKALGCIQTRQQPAQHGTQQFEASTCIWSWLLND